MRMIGKYIKIKWVKEDLKLFVAKETEENNYFNTIQSKGSNHSVMTIFKDFGN